MDERYKKHIQSLLKQNISRKNDFFGYDNERRQILELIGRTVENGESNSALLIGPRGSGKTTLVESVLLELQNNKNFINDSVLVKLHGLVHTDDRLALRSITSQMSLDNVVDGKVFGSFAENLSYLLACLRTGEKHRTKCIVFILEEFDLFCAHHNQTLLYNLFDVSQSAQAPICVLGVTCRLDVIELLEKRVKSRFSHRQMFLFPCQENNSLEYTLKRIEYYLNLREDQENDEINLPNHIRKQWKSNVKNLLTNTKFKRSIQRLIDINFSEISLKTLLIQVITQLRNDCHLSAELFQEQVDLMESDDMVQILQDLNVLELCLIISMKHHIEIYDNQPMNFEMIFFRYIKFANSNANIQNVQRPIVMKAFEHIHTLGIISMISGSETRIQKEYQFFKLLITPNQIYEGLNKCSGLPTEVIQWAKSYLA